MTGMDVPRLRVSATVLAQGSPTPVQPSSLDSALRLLQAVGLLLPLVAILAQVILQMFEDDSHDISASDRHNIILGFFLAIFGLTAGGSFLTIGIMGMTSNLYVRVGVTGIYLAFFGVAGVGFIITLGLASALDVSVGDIQQRLTSYRTEDVDDSADETDAELGTETGSESTDGDG